MTRSIYNTATLIAVVDNMKPPSAFLLDMFFPNVVESTTEEIAIDVVINKRRVAPFVSPLVQGKVVDTRGRRTDIFKPAYVKDKRRIDPTMPLKRAVGERIGGNLTPAEREQANLNYELEDQLTMLARREEVMAADALLDGKTYVAGEGFAPVLVDFQRDPELTVALESDGAWDDTFGSGSPSPVDDIEDWSTMLLKKSGIVARNLIFTPKSWRRFRKDPQLKEQIISTNVRGGDSRLDLGLEINTGGVMKGVWGQYNLWLYNDWYVDPVDDIEKPLLPDGTLLIGGAVDGTRNYGLVLDPKNNYQPGRYFPKSWLEEDPAQRWLMLQSAPLPVPTNVNACMAVNIAAGEEED